MTGTDKQIAWATKIQNHMVKRFDSIAAIYTNDPDMFASQEAYDTVVDALNVVREKILNIETAAEYIEIDKKADGIDDFIFAAMVSTGCFEM